MKILYEGRALLVGLEKVDISQYPKLRVIGCNCTGLDHLPWDEINKRKIGVVSLKGTPFLKQITSTAEHTFGLMIALLRNYNRSLNAIYADREEFKGHTLSGKTLGIIGGLGRIGKQMAKRARAFEMNVLSADKVLEADAELEHLLWKSDIVTIHIPLEGNEGFFTYKMIEKMKSTAYLINTSRDGVIERGALVKALENGMIKGAAIDFVDDPELIEYSRHNNNLILTPHQGGCTFEDMQATEDFILKQINNYMTKGV